MDLESVSVSVNSAAAQDATKVSPNKFTYQLSGLSTETEVSVTATAPFKKPASYQFKVKKGTLKVGIKSIKVDGRSISVAPALSDNGVRVEFDESNVLNKGAAKIEVELEDAYTSLTKNADPGFVKGSFKENSAKTSFSISALVISGADQGDTVPKDNKVTFELQASGKDNAKITLNLKNNKTGMPPESLGVFSPVTNRGYRYPVFLTETKPQGIEVLTCYSGYANVDMEMQGTEGFILYTKETSGSGEEWKANESKRKQNIPRNVIHFGQLYYR